MIGASSLSVIFRFPRLITQQLHATTKSHVYAANTELFNSYSITLEKNVSRDYYYNENGAIYTLTRQKYKTFY